MNPKARLRSALIEMIEKQLKPTVFLTLNLRRSAMPQLTRATVEHLLQRLEHRAHGKRWADFPPQLRLRAMAFLEHQDTNPHWHCLLSGPPEVMEVSLELAAQLWGGLIRNGHCDIQLVKNVQALSRYVTKELYKDWVFDSYLAYGPINKA